jgi:hypothetical protein
MIKKTLLTSQSPGVGKGHDIGNYCSCISMREVFKNILLNNYWARIAQINIKVFWGSAESRFKNPGFGGRAVWVTLWNTILNFLKGNGSLGHIREYHSEFFKGDIIKIRCTRTVQIHIRVSCWNATIRKITFVGVYLQW